MLRGAIGFVFALAMSFPCFAQEAKLKNLVNIEGVRSNELVGYGIVFGLQASGDTASSVVTKRAVAKMLTQLGVNATQNELVSGSFASVIATAELPAFARSGDRVDIRLSTNGDAKSLAGGTLLLTSLRAGDGKVYVAAQGPVVVGQAEGKGASVLTVATVPGGGLVEREFVPELAPNKELILSLKKADFTTNARIAQAINDHFRGFYATSLNSGSIKVALPKPFYDKAVAFVAQMEGLQVAVDRAAVVVLNERTGTVVMGSDVTVGPVTIAHGTLSLVVTDPKTKKSKERSLLTVKGTTVGDIVNSLNTLGVKPKDLIGIIQAVHAAGALQGELKFI